MIFFLTFLTYSLTLSIFAYHFLFFFSVFGTIVVLMVEPYKEEYANYNIVDCLVFLNHALFCFLMSMFDVLLNRVPLYLITGSIFFVATLPVVYITTVVIIRTWKRVCPREHQTIVEGSLPHRVTHSSEYNCSPKPCNK